MTENGLIITLNLDEICRLCLKNEEDLTDVFDETYTKEGMTLAERIYKIGSLKICVDDGLPITVCNMCHQKVEDAYEFRLQMIEADNLLRQCVEEDSVTRTSDEIILLKKKSNNLDAKNTNQGQVRNDSSEENTDLRLVCVEDDGTQVFTLDENNSKITDSVEILPLNGQNISKPHKQLPNKNEDCEVVVVSKKSKLENETTSVPLSIVKDLSEKGVLNNCNDLLKLSLNDSNLSSKNCTEIETTKNNENTLKSNENYMENFLEIKNDNSSKVLIIRNVAQNSSEGCFITGDNLNEFELNQEINSDLVKSNKKLTSNSDENNKDLQEHAAKDKVLLNVNKASNLMRAKKKLYDIGLREDANVDFELNCQLCLERFTNYDRLKNHIAAHFEGFLMNESIVDEEDSGDEDLKTYTKTKPQSCKYCRLRFKDVSELTKHSESEHSDNKFCCSKCSERFVSELDYKSHYKLNHYSLECDVCNKKFNSYLELQTHVSVIHYNGSFWCQPCSKSFAQKYDFILHQRRHLNIKPFGCTFCDKHFVTSTLCKEHVRRHTNNKPYLCKCCGKSYVKHTELKAHEILHSKEASIVCEFCSKKFSSLSSYKLHRKRHELGSRFVCKICDKSYFTKSEMQRHEQKHSGVRLYPCMICDNSFYSQPELNRHILYHKGEKKYQCTQCGKSYYESGHLRIHERSHSGIRPFACNICPKKFISRPKLIRHLKTHKDVAGSVSLSPESKIKRIRRKVIGNDLNNYDVDKNVIFENINDTKVGIEDVNSPNIIEISDYDRQVINLDSMVVNCSGNVIEMAEGSLVEMADGNFILMDNSNMINRINSISDENELVLNTIDENVKIEIIDTK